MRKLILALAKIVRTWLPTILGLTVVPPCSYLALTLPLVPKPAVANQTPEQPIPGITFENLDRIMPGMTEKEVETILGRPGVDFGSDGQQRNKERPYLKSWAANGIFIVVMFDPNGKVNHAVLYNMC
jgi:hypothetical protein